jgi:hypothetical protein
MTLNSRFLPFKLDTLTTIVFLFLANFPNLAKTQKEAGEANKWICEIFFKLPYLNPKNLDVARFRQCVPVVGQN